MPSFDTEWNIFYTCDITLDQCTVTKPLVSPEGGVPLADPFQGLPSSLHQDICLNFRDCAQKLLNNTEYVLRLSLFLIFIVVS